MRKTKLNRKKELIDSVMNQLGKTVHKVLENSDSTSTKRRHHINEMARKLVNRTIDPKSLNNVRDTILRHKYDRDWAKTVKPIPRLTEMDLLHRYVGALLVYGEPCPETEEDIDKIGIFANYAHALLDGSGTIDDIKLLYSNNDKITARKRNGSSRPNKAFRDVKVNSSKSDFNFDSEDIETPSSLDNQQQNVDYNDDNEDNDLNQVDIPSYDEVDIEEPSNDEADIPSYDEDDSTEDSSEESPSEEEDDIPPYDEDDSTEDSSEESPSEEEDNIPPYDEDEDSSDTEDYPSYDDDEDENSSDEENDGEEIIKDWPNFQSITEEEYYDRRLNRSFVNINDDYFFYDEENNKVGTEATIISVTDSDRRKIKLWCNTFGELLEHIQVIFESFVAAQSNLWDINLSSVVHRLLKEWNNATSTSVHDRVDTAAQNFEMLKLDGLHDIEDVIEAINEMDIDELTSEN